MTEGDNGHILAHDLGTTGNKASLYDTSGNLISSEFYGYETHYPKSNWVEQEPGKWWKAFRASTKELLEKAKIGPEALSAICFSGQMMGCLPVNQKGEPLRNSIIWADQRGVKQEDELKEKIGKRGVYEITGHRPSANYSAAKMMWIRDEEPKKFDETHKFLQAKDYIVFKLTGKFATDYSDASGTNLFDLEKKEWSREILEETDIPRNKLPEPVPSSKIVGNVTEKASKKTGLDRDTPVVIGGGDGSCAATGAGVIEEGDSYNYLGSSSWIASATEKPVYDSEMSTFNWVHLDDKKYSPCGTMQAAGGSLEWGRDVLGKEVKRAAKAIGVDPYELIDLKVTESVPGSHGLIFLPHLIGERSPRWNPDARGAFIGLTKKHTTEDLLRAIIEGVTLNLRIILETLERYTTSFDEIKIIGGGAKSSVWRNIMADIYGKTILLTDHPREATSLGAAIAGGVGVEIFDDFGVAKKLLSFPAREEPDPKKHRIYNEIYEVFDDSYQNLEDVFKKLSDMER